MSVFGTLSTPATSMSIILFPYSTTPDTNTCLADPCFHAHPSLPSKIEMRSEKFQIK